VRSRLITGSISPERMGARMAVMWILIGMFLPEPAARAVQWGIGVAWFLSTEQPAHTRRDHAGESYPPFVPDLWLP
jgi:hypothetical protein